MSEAEEPTYTPGKRRRGPGRNKGPTRPQAFAKQWAEQVEQEAAERWPQEVWPVTRLITELMAERGWPEVVLVRMMQRPTQTWTMGDMDTAPLSEGNAVRLAYAFDIPKQLFLGYDRAYMDARASGFYDEAADGHLIKKAGPF